MTLRSVIRGSGSALPARAVPNAEMATLVDTTDEWIVERTGIRNRYIAGEGETTGTLATEAARRALEAAGIEPGEIDLIAEREGLLAFVEVKARPTLVEAAHALGPRQRARLMAGAEAWLASNPGHGDAGMRFDVILVAADGAAVRLRGDAVLQLAHQPLLLLGVGDGVLVVYLFVHVCSSKAVCSLLG